MQRQWCISKFLSLDLQPPAVCELTAPKNNNNYACPTVNLGQFVPASVSDMFRYLKRIKRKEEVKSMSSCLAFVPCLAPTAWRAIFKHIFFLDGQGGSSPLCNNVGVVSVFCCALAARRCDPSEAFTFKTSVGRLICFHLASLPSMIAIYLSHFGLNPIYLCI